MPYPYVTFGSQVNRSLEPVTERILRKREIENQAQYNQGLQDQAQQRQFQLLNFTNTMEQAKEARLRQQQAQDESSFAQLLQQNGFDPAEAASVAKLHVAGHNVSDYFQNKWEREHPKPVAQPNPADVARAGLYGAQEEQTRSETANPERFRAPQRPLPPPKLNPEVYKSKMRRIEKRLMELNGFMGEDGRWVKGLIGQADDPKPLETERDKLMKDRDALDARFESQGVGNDPGENDLPAGSVLIGHTADGAEVYQDAQGNKFKVAK